MSFLVLQCISQWKRERVVLLFLVFLVSCRCYRSLPLPHGAEVGLHVWLCNFLVLLTYFLNIMSRSLMAMYIRFLAKKAIVVSCDKLSSSLLMLLNLIEI